MNRRRVVILVSGRGSNMTALIEAARAPDFPAQIVGVIANVPDAGALEKAAAAGLPTAVVDHRTYKEAGRQAFDRALDGEIRVMRADLVVLAGFMRLLTPWFVDTWRDRLINIHPSLLPSYKGLHTHERALADGVKLAGCTVHFVRADMDDGPMIGQAAVPVLSSDTPDSLAARVLAAEWRLYPAALAAVASGRARVTRDPEGRERVVFDPAEPPVDPLIWLG
jgi:formyltetrahydrofolate-dependent phosphoribosylglycinamide formyltransferase